MSKDTAMTGDQTSSFAASASLRMRLDIDDVATLAPATSRSVVHTSASAHHAKARTSAALVKKGQSGYITGNLEINMGSSQKRAIRNYRSRLSKRGLARFEVLGRDGDRDLIRSLARRLAEDGPEASRLRAAVSQTIAGKPPKRGGILAALRRSPMAGADLDLTRPREDGRKVDL
jgi:hypothetical protein